MKKWTMLEHALSETKTILGVISAFMTIICLIDFNSIFPELHVRIIIVCGIFFIAFLAAVIKTISTRRVEVDLGEGRTAVVEYGDLFERGDTVVIPVNDSFDTIADDITISKNSVHGQFVKHFYEDNTEELNRLIAGELKGISPLGEYGDEKRGNKVFYPLGTVICIRTGNKKYYWVATTHFKGNCIQPDLQGYYLAILKLMEYLNAHTSGKDVYMPLIGSGLTRLDKTKQLILENFLTILKMSKTSMVGKVHIVLYKGDLKEFNLHKIL